MERKKQIVTCIADDLYRNFEIILERNGYGLFSGSAGVALFMYYYGYSTRSFSYISRAEKIMSEIFHYINTHPDKVFYNYAEGIAGLYAVLLHLQFQGMISEDFFDYGEEMDIFFKRLGCVYIEEGNNDFCYGSAGLLFLMSLRCRSVPDGKMDREIGEMMEALIHSHHIDNQVFISDFRVDGQVEISIPHGLSSWLLILSRLKTVCRDDRIDSLLKKLIRYYIPYIREVKKGETPDSFFPEVIFNKRRIDESVHSRLGWCYGDLPCLLASLAFAEAYGKEKLCRKILSQLTQAASRRNKSHYSVYDAGLCHGASGISLIFRLLFFRYSIPAFDEAANYWLEQVVLQWKDDHDFYKRYKSDNKIIESKEYGLLEGLTGVGLFLLGEMTGDYRWAELMLLKGG